MILFAILPFAVQETLRGAWCEGNSVERPIQWGGLRAALDASIDPDWATTEEAYTLLVRLGQAPTCHGVLEAFARKAEEGAASQHMPHPSDARLPRVGCGTEGNSTGGLAGSMPHDARVSPAKKHDQPERDDSWVDSPTLSRGEASSGLLESGEIATLAAELDPLRRVDRAFAALEKTFGDEKSKKPKAVQRRFYRSPLHGYAAARRYRGWHDKLEVTGNALATIRLRLGRRGQDILAEARSAVAPEIPRPQAEVTAEELMAQAKALAGNPVRRQTALGNRNGSERCGYVLTARAQLYAPLPDRSGRAIRAFDGWGYYEGAAEIPRTGARDSKDTGEAVAVLEVSPEPGRQVFNTNAGRGRALGENMALTVSLLSVPDLREHPGLMKFHPEAKVIVDGGDNTAGGSGDCAAGGTAPLRIVCERLEGWRSLRDVILQHGPLASPSAMTVGEDSGMRVLRLWGRQLATVLECLASKSLVLRDLRASTVFVSPDGSKVKVVSFSTLTTVTSEGDISSEAPSLDHNIHGPSEPLTPPEALAIRRSMSESSRDVHDGGVFDNRDVRRDVTLVLAGDEGPGAFGATTAWDTWTFGVLLFELAFGVSPPAFGTFLGPAATALTEIAVSKDASPPELGEVARTIEYDFLSALEGGVAGGNTGERFHAFPPLTEALGRTPLDAATGVQNLQASTAEGEPVPPPSYLTQKGSKAVEGFRRAWVRRQLQMEESGAVGVVTWQTFQEKVKHHLDASVPAVASLVSRPANGKALSRGGDDRGGGRLALAHDHDGTAMSTQTTVGAKVVDRIKVRLLAQDHKESGWLPFQVVLRVVSEELQLSFSTKETELIAACLQDGAPAHQVDNSDTQGHVRQAGNVFYAPLLHVLLDSLTPLPKLQTVRTGQALPLSIPTSFEELLRSCLEPDPDRRPRPGDLRHLPFLLIEDCVDGHESQNDGDLSAASAYMSGSGSEFSAVWALRERVERSINACENAGLSDVPIDGGAPRKGKAVGIFNRPCLTTGTDSRYNGPVHTFGAGELAKALKELERLVHRQPVHGFVDDPLQARRVARGHAKLIDEVFESGFLLRASALALRFQDREEVCAFKIETYLCHDSDAHGFSDAPHFNTFRIAPAFLRTKYLELMGTHSAGGATRVNEFSIPPINSRI